MPAKRVTPLPFPDPERDRLRWLCSLLYFREGIMDHLEIGRLAGGLDRRQVSRLLREAETRGWVRFIADPPADEVLGRQLERRFGLSGALVVAAPTDPEDLPRVLGGAGAAYLRECLSALWARPGPGRAEPVRVGISGGRTIYYVVDSLPAPAGRVAAGGRAPRSPRPEGLTVEVVPVSRNPAPEANSLRLSGGELASLLAERLAGTTPPSLPYFRFLPPPERDEEAAALLERYASRGLDYSRLDIVLSGVGGLDSETMAWTREAFGLGDDAEVAGEFLGLPLMVAECRLRASSASGLSFERLDQLLGRTPPRPILAVAGGAGKVRAILWLLGRGGPERRRISHLVTDEVTAGSLLEASGGGVPARASEGIPVRVRHLWTVGYLSYLAPNPDPTSERLHGTRTDVMEATGGLSGKTSTEARRIEVTALARRALFDERPCIALRADAPRAHDLEARLVRLLRIDVRVAAEPGVEAAARLAARYVEAELAERCAILRRRPARGAGELRIGVAGGRTVRAVVGQVGGHDFLSPGSPRVRVYPLVCRPPTDDVADSVVADVLTQRFRGARSCEMLRHRAASESELREITSLPYIESFRNDCRSVDLAIMGIGTGTGVRPDQVADLCGRSVDAAGNPLAGPPFLIGVELAHLGEMFLEAEDALWRRARSLTLEPGHLRRLHRLLGVASGPDKLAPVSAVLRRNLAWARGSYQLMRSKTPSPERQALSAAGAPWLNVLIVDAELGERLVDHLGRDGS